jgi:UDP:flavonoid glycosyltransferase YjiC (YdhE family)
MKTALAKERVLVAPLHWGLGHATRCIPLIKAELAAGNEVIIAAEKGPRALLEEAFPHLAFTSIPFMEITYPRDGNMARHFFFQGPKLLWSILQEHRVLQRLIKKEKIDRVLSDARFGLWSKCAKCIFIHHQIEIRSPMFQGFINMLNRWVMRQYDEVWVPDFASAPGLAGTLSHPQHTPPNLRYIGPLSRFEHAVQPATTTEWDVVAIVSGPEPQRSLFEESLIARFKASGERVLLLRGKPDEGKASSQMGQLTVVPHLSNAALLDALSKTKKVIARSGYSTIMDLHVLGITNVEYYPTPGQTEQVYLAELHNA